MPGRGTPTRAPIRSPGASSCSPSTSSTRKAAAKAAYTRLQQATKDRTRLNGLGNAAYQAPDGTLVARKDQFVLDVDPTGAPAGVRPADLAFAAVVAVMGCW